MSSTTNDTPTIIEIYEIDSTNVHYFTLPEEHQQAYKEMQRHDFKLAYRISPEPKHTVSIYHNELDSEFEILQKDSMDRQQLEEAAIILLAWWNEREAEEWLESAVEMIDEAMEGQYEPIDGVSGGMSNVDDPIIE